VLKEFPCLNTIRNLQKVFPVDGINVVPGDVDLEWENVALDLNNPTDVYVEVLFGTEPNEANPAYDIAALTLDPVSGLDVTSVTVPGLTDGTYYWQVNLYLYGDPGIVDYNTGDPSDPNKYEGHLWTFDVVGDPVPIIESITGDQMTWSGEPVPLEAIITNEGDSATIIEWVAYPTDDVEIIGRYTATPTVTITKAPSFTATIANASFEDPAVANGTGNWDEVPAWTKVEGGGLANPDTDSVAFPDSIIWAEPLDGEQCAWLNPNSSLSKVLSETVQSGVTYTLNVDIGRGQWSAGAKYKVQLIAVDGENEVVLAEDDNSLMIASQTWETSEISYTNDPVADANKLDLPLMIKLVNPATSAGGADIEFDNVVLTADSLFPIASGVETVTMTVFVSDEANPTPVQASVEIDVYDDACAMARIAFDADNLADLDKDCVIDIDDLASVAATWLNDTSIDAPAVSPDKSVKPLIINGEFNIYKPGTNYEVLATLAGGSTPRFSIDGHGIGGDFSFDDGTTGALADMPGWIRSSTRNPADVMPDGIDNSTVMHYYGIWSGSEGDRDGTRVISAAPLGIISGGTTYTLAAMVKGFPGTRVLRLLADGEEVITASKVDPADSDEWNEISRTYDHSILVDYVGKAITVELGIHEDDINEFVGSSVFDNVTLVAEVTDLNLPSVDAGDNMITWTDETVTLAPTVTANDVPISEEVLSYLWTAEPGDGVVFNPCVPGDPNSSTAKAPTVTITKPVGDMASVRLILAVTLDDVGLTNDTMTIDVYDNVCLAALASNPELDYDLGDISEDCITNLDDFAEMAAAWLVDYSSTEPADQPEEE